MKSYGSGKTRAPTSSGLRATAVASATIIAIMLAGCSDEKAAIASPAPDRIASATETPAFFVTDREDLDMGALMTAAQRGWPYLVALDIEDIDLGRSMSSR